MIIKITLKLIIYGMINHILIILMMKNLYRSEKQWKENLNNFNEDQHDVSQSSVCYTISKSSQYLNIDNEDDLCFEDFENHEALELSNYLESSRKFSDSSENFSD